MEKKLVSFFQVYPVQGNLKLALKMVKEKLKDSIEAIEEKKEGDEYLKHLSDAHRMLEAIFTEIAKHPDSYR